MITALCLNFASCKKQEEPDTADYNGNYEETTLSTVKTLDNYINIVGRSDIFSLAKTDAFQLKGKVEKTCINNGDSASLIENAANLTEYDFKLIMNSSPVVSSYTKYDDREIVNYLESGILYSSIEDNKVFIDMNEKLYSYYEQLKSSVNTASDFSVNITNILDAVVDGDVSADCIKIASSKKYLKVKITPNDELIKTMYMRTNINDYMNNLAVSGTDGECFYLFDKNYVLISSKSNISYTTIVKGVESRYKSEYSLEKFTGTITPHEKLDTFVNENKPPKASNSGSSAKAH